MTIYSNRVTVGTAVTQIVPPSTMAQEVSLLNAGTTIVRIGAEDVTTTAWGLPVIGDSPNATRNFFYASIEAGDSIWGITAAGSAAVNVWSVRKS
jgi:hypothetical protein